jgi:hypothetical protein
MQYFIMRDVENSTKIGLLKLPIKARPYYLISIISLGALGILIGILIFQQFYFKYYLTSITMLIITISYGVAAVFMVRLSLLFLSWFRSNHNYIVFLYFVSVSIIALNLVTTATFVNAKVNERPDYIGIFIGGSGDISGGKHLHLDYLYRITSFLSFFSIWITTFVLMNYYREKLINAIAFFIVMAVPLIYFVISFFYQYILSSILTTYMEIDPIALSIVLSAFLALSKPIGGLIFGAVFWNISRFVGYERNVKTFMILSGWGIFLIFACNQAASQIVALSPPFGLSTITVLNLASLLVLLGIYGSARLVSVNNELRKSIQIHAMQSSLLRLIGQAEMENEIQKTVTNIIQNQQSLVTEKPTQIELDEQELKKYIDLVLRETKKNEGQ